MTRALNVLITVAMEHCDDRGREYCDDRGYGALR